MKFSSVTDVSILHLELREFLFYWKITFQPDLFYEEIMIQKKEILVD